MCARAGSDPSSSSFTIDQIGGMMGHATPEKWQAAIEALILVVELGGPTMMGAHRRHAGVEPPCRAGVQSRAQRDPLGEEKAQEGPMTVFVYVNTSKQVGDAEHVKVFATTDAAEKWFEENDPEGVAFEYEVLE
jgi:hypothetical protein